MGDGTNHANLKRVRFGPFRFNAQTGDLQRNGIAVELQNTPARLLEALLTRPGELFPREELCARLWPSGLHVDFENNLNNAVARLRRVLGAEYIETVPRRGYRFIGRTWLDTPEPPIVSAADQALRKGRHFRDRTTVRDLWRAAGYFEQAIAARPDCSEAYARLADVYVLLGDDVLGALPAESALPQANELARTAIAIEPECGAAYATLAMVAWRLDWDWIGAEELFGQARALDPANPTTFQYYSWLLQAAGRASDARDAMARALALAPTSSFVSANVGWMLYLDRRYDAAIEQLHETLELDENYALARLPLGLALQQTGRLTEAIDQFRFGWKRSGDAYYRATLGQALVKAGFHGQASAILMESDSGHVSAYNRATIYAALGDEDGALCHLESAAAEHSTALPFLNVDPLFDRLRGSGRYHGIAQRMGLQGGQ